MRSAIYLYSLVRFRLSNIIGREMKRMLQNCADDMMSCLLADEAI